MKAIVKFTDGLKGYEMREVAEPVPAKDELLLEIQTVGICGTDIHIVQDEYPHSIPVILGHEYVATVAAAGGEADGFKIGDTVVSLACAYTCQACDFCKSGLPMMCSKRRSLGSWSNGAMCRYMVVPARSCFKVDGAPTNEMAAFEPAACCVRAVHEIGEVRSGDVVLVSGAGLMGQICMQLCKRAGARVIVAGLPSDAERLATAASLGADQTADSPEAIAAALAGETALGAHIDEDVDPAIIGRLMEMPEFVKAYEPDGMRADSFITFGSCNHTLDQFVNCGWNLLKELEL